MSPKSPSEPPKTAFKTVTKDENGIRLDRWLKRHFQGLSHGETQKLLRTGQIRVDGKRAEASNRVEDGQSIRIPPALALGGQQGPKATGGKKPMRNPQKLASLILYQDDDVVALNKPAGLAVQGGTGLKENLDDSLMALSLDGKTRPKLVHRLDRDTSGVLLIARTDYAAEKLTAAFRTRATQKVYWAATVGVPVPDEGRIEAPLIKTGQIMAVADEDDDAPEAKSATTLYKVIESVPRKMAFVALWPLTGRTHQLRVHLAHLGTPIWKDRLYGVNKEDEEALGLAAMPLGGGLHLHARRLMIPHPRKGVIDVTAPLGVEMKKTWRSFGFSEKAKVDFDDL